MTRRKSSGSAIQDHMDSLGIGRNEMMLIGGLAVAAYVIYKGGIEGAANAATKALVNAASGAATGVITGTASGVGSVFGLPTTDETTQDPYVARWIIDNPVGGMMAASEWASAGAFVQAVRLPAGSGTPPPPGSKLAEHFMPSIDVGGVTGQPW